MKFRDMVFDLVKKVPKGKVTTYGEIARALGNRAAARAVGNAISKNPFPVKIPCHRVVREDGRIGGYVSGTHMKQKILRGEGIVIAGGKIDLRSYMFRFDESKVVKCSDSK